MSTEGTPLTRSLFVRLPILVLLSLFVTAAAPLFSPVDAQTLEAPPALNDGWETAAPGEVGLDPGRLAELTGALRSGEFGNVHALLIERDGKLIYEAYFEGEDWSWGSELGQVRFGRASLHDLRSVTKSVVSTLVGIALDRGLIASVDVPLRKLLPDHAHLLTGEKADLRLRHVLTMSAGLEWDETSVPYTDPANDERRMNAAADPVAFTLDRPLVNEPGSTFNYSGGLTQVLAAVLEDATGQDVEAFAREALFGPLAIYDVVWRRMPASERPAAASGLRLRARDLAKLGSVFLHDGRWNDGEIVSAGWVEAATRPHLTFRFGDEPEFVAENGYGYQWWYGRYRTPGGELDAPTAAGNGSQRVILVPELGLSVTMFAGLYDTSDPEEIWMPDRLVVEHLLVAVEAAGGP